MECWIRYYLRPLFPSCAAGVEVCSIAGPAIVRINEIGYAGGGGDRCCALPAIAAIMGDVEIYIVSVCAVHAHWQDAICRREKSWRCYGELSRCLRRRKSQGLGVPCLPSIMRSVEQAQTGYRITPCNPTCLPIQKAQAGFLASKRQMTWRWGIR